MYTCRWNGSFSHASIIYAISNNIHPVGRWSHIGDQANKSFSWKTIFFMSIWLVKLIKEDLSVFCIGGKCSQGKEKVFLFQILWLHWICHPPQTQLLCQRHIHCLFAVLLTSLQTLMLVWHIAGKCKTHHWFIKHSYI